MKVFYSELNQEKNTKDPIIALVRNNHWFLWGLKEKSRYFGYWIKKDTQLFKLIDSIELYEEIERIEVLEPHLVKLFCRESVIELMLDGQGLILKSNRAFKVKINFDFKKIFSSQPFGNNYQVIPLNKGYGVNFTQEQEHYNLHAYLFFEGELKFNNRWREIENEFDRSRQTQPGTAWALEAFEGYCSELKFFCPDKTVNSLSLAQLLRSRETYTPFILKRTLSLFDGYFLAGLPWFSQNWFRDELICLWLLQPGGKTHRLKTVPVNGADRPRPADPLRGNKQLSLIKTEVLNRYLQHLENFVFINRLGGEAAVDTFLWVIYLLSEQQIKDTSDKLKLVTQEWLKRYFKNNRVIAPAQATWMDTLDRPISVENEALFLKVIEKLKPLKIEGLAQTHESYFRKLKTYLTTELYPKAELEKPNLFLGYLISPELLSKRKWEKFFDQLIKNNFCAWGGFSTLPRSDQDFHWFSTGQNPASYHQGDSWFWLNNLAAIAMQNLNPVKYKTYIEKIKAASLKNLLELGALGWPSELSSSAQLRSEGSPIQLWSLVSLLKLLEN